MRERSAESRARAGRAQRVNSRGSARTMPRWLLASLLLAAAGAGVSCAWTPPDEPLLLVPRSRRHANAARHIQLLGWQLELQENRAIRSPDYDECQFYKGRVIGEEHSVATVTECAGQLYGLLRVGEENFILEPNRADGAHVLRRRDVFLSEHPEAYNLTGDTVADLDLDLEEDAEITPVSHVRPRHSDPIEMDYFRAETISRPVSGVKGLWLELAIVADHTMMKFHGDRVKHYILALMNIVSAIFNDPSLESNMTLVINKLYLYGEDSIVKYGNVKKSLEAVNKWNYRHLIKIPPGSASWDATVWLTRAPLGGPSGFAPVGGVCSMTRSAAIDRDEGLTSAFVIAHELAHLLGLTHDDSESCQTEASHGSVMAPIVLATLHNYAWSSCSKKQFHEKTQNWACLHERSRTDGVELVGAKAISNYVFTMDEQCRTGFGEGFSVCKTVKVRSACSRLWCAHRAMPHVCRSKRAPPLEGTPCGKNRWCVDRVCEPMPGHGSTSRSEKEYSLTNGFEDEKPMWSEWGDWSECTADCGYGLRVRARKCRHNGIVSQSLCEGAGSQMSVCWAGHACAAARDPRAELCHRRARELVPYVPADESKQCEMWCVQYTGGEASNYGALPDGTACSYEKPFDVCSQGTCVRGQCNATDPACNWCPDGYCNNNTYIYTKRLGKEWTRLTLVPHEAHQLSIHVTTPVPLHIALRERKRDKPVLELSKHSKRIEIQQDNYLKYDPNVPQNLQIIEVDSHVIDIKEGGYRWEGEVVAAGTLLRWIQTDTDVFISSTARLQTDLMIMGIPEHQPVDAASVQVAVNYSTPAAHEHRRPLEYRWSITRGPCSASCGGGHRAVRPRCSRDMSTKCPPTRYEPCNTHSCEFVWATGEWEECSATCGGAGVQERQLFCVPSNLTASARRSLIKSSVSPALCPSTAPDKQQACNRLQCPVYWREMPWTPCSTTCGRGTSRRPLSCPAAEERACGPRPRERRRRCHLRRCRPSRLSRLTLPCPPADNTHYCEQFDTDDLMRNCQVPPFRKYCCNTCRLIDRYTHIFG